MKLVGNFGKNFQAGLQWRLEETVAELLMVELFQRPIPMRASLLRSRIKRRTYEIVELEDE